MTRSGEVRFDGPAVRAVAAALSQTAITTDDGARRALGSVECGECTVGPRYRTYGSAIEHGYRALRRSLDDWAAETEQHAGRLIAAADEYEGTVDTTATVLGAFGGRWMP